jgi:hypothetical protein
MNQLIKLNNSLTKALIVVTGFSLLVSTVVANRSASEFTSQDESSAELEQQQMIQVLAQRDQASDLSPYLQLVTQLEKSCVEDSTQIIGIAATITKKAQQSGMKNYSYKEGLAELLDWVSDKDGTASCMDTYLDIYAD